MVGEVLAAAAVEKKDEPKSNEARRFPFFK